MADRNNLRHSRLKILSLQALTFGSIVTNFGPANVHHVDGQMFKIIHSLHAYAKSCVRKGHAKSESFVSNGFRQGEKI